MTLFQNLWRAIGEHVVLMLMMLPALGAVMTRIVGPQSVEGARSLARANTWISVALLVVVVAQLALTDRVTIDGWYLRSTIPWVTLPLGHSRHPTEIADAEDEHSPSTASSTSSDVAAASRINIAVGIDGVGLPFVALVVAVCFAVVRAVPQRTGEHLSLSDVLLTQSALLGVLTATDAVWLSVCLLGATGTCFVLISRAGGAQRRLAAAKFLRPQLLSGLMLSAAALGLVVSCWWMSIRDEGTLPLTFDLPTVLDRVPRLMLGSQAAHDHWELSRSWLFFLIAGGCLLRLPMPPFHPWLPAVAQQTERGTLALLLVGWLPTSFIWAVRLLPRVFESELGQLGERVLVWCAVSALGMASASLVVRDINRRRVLLMLAPLALSFGGLWIGSASAIQGAVLLLAGTCGVGACSLLLPSNVHGQSGSHLALRLLAIIAIGPGGWCLFRNLFVSAELRVWCVGAVAACVWSLATWPHDEQPGLATASRSFRVDRLSLLPLVVVLMLIGWAPQAVLKVIAPSLPPVATEDLEESST